MATDLQPFHNFLWNPLQPWLQQRLLSADLNSISLWRFGLVAMQVRRPTTFSKKLHLDFYLHTDKLAK